ncbi:hypothetical protein SCHPADRAFT_944891 [Schizopora paradoxa]|uniref:Uncharacterized protein n=1 Tax=Schizopora paradoxa TaxID=27342 RepID=A0A0H2REC3_9AGAM|nr:hypothetical protein SCHPADRAFT_944891 [Schizopora paradoxa]
MLNKNPTNHRVINPSTESTRYRGLRSMFGRKKKKEKSNLEKPRLPIRPDKAGWYIRTTCRHHETTIDQRHASPSTTTVKPSSAIDKRGVKKLCLILLESCRSDQDALIQAEAKNEILELSISDPRVREEFWVCISEDSFTDLEDTLSHALSEVLEPVHDLWSEFIGQQNMQKLDEAARRKCCESLKATLSDSHPECFFLASEYLKHALSLKLKGQGLEFLYEIWDYFVNNLVKNKTPFTWTTMNSYVEIMELSKKPMFHFVSPAHLSSMAPFLIRAATPGSFHSIFRLFFSLPNMECDVSRGSRVRFLIAPDQRWNIDEVASYAVAFANNLSKEELNPIGLSGTVLQDSTWMSLYRVVEYASSNYRRGEGISAEGGELAASGQLEDDLLAVAEFAISRWGSTDTAYYANHTVCVDRYCKNALEMSSRWSKPDYSREIFEFVSYVYVSFTRKAMLSRSGADDFAYIPYFRNVPYLRRFKFRGMCIVSSDSLPEFESIMRIATNIFERTPQDFFTGSLTVDTMLLDERMLACLRVDGDKQSFDETGHFPVLAGYNASGDPLYVAIVRIADIWYFTTIMNGATEASYVDELGDTHTTLNFFVLALRHDPSYLRSPYPTARPGSMDPTGPFFWLQLWPEKDPNYFVDERLTDDRILESFLPNYFPRK